MKTDLRKKAKNDFEKDFVKLMNDFVFRKITEKQKQKQEQQQQQTKIIFEKKYIY